jgi:hypothetical protein
MPPPATALLDRRSISAHLPPSAALALDGTGRGRTEARWWTITANDGSVVTGYLPEWAQDDPSAKGVRADELPAVLVGVTHWAGFEGAALPAFSAETGGADGPAAEVQVFGSSIVCHPYPDPHQPGELRIPFAEVQITPDHWMTELDPDALTAVAATLRTLADRFENVLGPQLVAARAEWAEHHPAATAPAPQRNDPTEERKSA